MDKEGYICALNGRIFLLSKGVFTQLTLTLTNHILFLISQMTTENTRQT